MKGYFSVDNAVETAFCVLRDMVPSAGTHMREFQTSSVGDFGLQTLNGFDDDDFDDDEDDFLDDDLDDDEMLDDEDDDLIEEDDEDDEEF